MEPGTIVSAPGRDSLLRLEEMADRELPTGCLWASVLCLVPTRCLALVGPLWSETGSSVSLGQRLESRAGHCQPKCDCSFAHRPVASDQHGLLNTEGFRCRQMNRVVTAKRVSLSKDPGTVHDRLGGFH